MHEKLKFCSTLFQTCYDCQICTILQLGRTSWYWFI